MKSMFHGETRVAVIDATEEAMREHGTGYGAEVINLSAEHIRLLSEGKCLALFDGEYVNFLVLDEEDP